jgi:hypothetical protein
MLHFQSNRGVRFCDGITRREFLRVGSLAVGMSLTELARLQAGPASQKSCIQLCLIGGPSQLDTWDPKPNAPAEIRGPFRAIRTNVPGIDICEHFPLMARMADRYAIVRSVYHKEAPIHENGLQLLQTGRLSAPGGGWPHCGAVMGRLKGPRGDMPPWVIVEGPLRGTGVHIGHGQSTGPLGDEFGAAMWECGLADPTTTYGLDPARRGDPHALLDAVDTANRCLDMSGVLGVAAASDVVVEGRTKQAFNVAAEPEQVRERYGWNTFGQNCLLARRLVERGVRLVTVNMFDTVFNQVTWDCHANGGDLPTTLDDYGRTLCPMFDAAYSALLDDLMGRGLLATTLVVAMGEFGRTPRINPGNGRDHWPGVWSVLLAGGGVRGGQIVGASDAHGAAPKDRPVHAPELAATIYHALGVDPATRLPNALGPETPLVDAAPVLELF